MRNRLLFTLLVLLVALPAHPQYQQALPGYRYQFPRDYFNHPEYRTEWWYYTGNLKTTDGHRFGFELTFFRQAVGPGKTTTPTAWEIGDIYLAHLTLSDLDGGRFYHSERINRAGPGLAGVSESSAKIWNGNWQVQWVDGTQRLQAIADSFSLRLQMTSTKPPVIHGKDGVSQKSAGFGHTSHYISFTRLQTAGILALGGKNYQLDGVSWMDHEFFTPEMDPNQAGWDWLSLQLDDNTELMLYRFRHRDGTVDPYSSGTYVDAAGNSRFLATTDFTIQPRGENYTSPVTHASYPTQWQVAVPSLKLELAIRTPLPSQELVSQASKRLTYWEGAIVIRGTRDGVPASGVGYLEMTGYGSAPFLGDSNAN